MKKLILYTFWVMFLIFNGSCEKREYVHAVTDFTFTSSSFVEPSTVTFTNASTFAKSYKWEFGDGTTSTDINPVKTYTKYGSYVVSLTATDETGSETVKKTVVIKRNDDPPKATFTYSLSRPISPDTVTFVNTSYNAETYLWNFGDGTTSTDKNPVHVYVDPGTYNVKLVVKNHITKDSLTQTFVVKPPPPPKAIFTYTTQGWLPLVVNFTNSSTGATTYDWDFGDGTKSFLQNPPQHTYNNVGAYKVKLITQSKFGTDSMVKIINVYPIPTTVKITKISLMDFPTKDSNGLPWDNFDGPDVYFDFWYNSAFIYTSNVINNCSAGTPAEWPVNISFPNTTSNFEVVFTDYDSIGANDQMGTVSFNFNDYTTGPNPYPSVVSKTSGGFTVKYELQWQ